MRFHPAALNLIVLALLLYAGVGCSAPPATLFDSPVGSAAALFTDAPAPEGAGATADPTVLRSRFVYVNLALLVQEDGSPKSLDQVGALVLNLFDDVHLTAILDRLDTAAPGSDTWTGHIEGVEHSQVTLVVQDGVMVGNVTLPDEFYQVRHVSHDTHVVYEIDQAAFPPELEPIPVETP